MARRRQRKQSHNSPPYSEVALGVRFKNGDREAFDQLWDKYSPKVRTWLSKRWQPDEIDDALQQAALNAWERRATLDETKGDFGAWLLGIATNAALDDLATRRHQRTNSDGVIDSASELETSEVGATAGDGSQTLLPLELAIRGIISSFQLAEQKIWCAGMHHEEGERWAAKLAKELGLKPSLIRTKFIRLKKIVRDKLTKQGFSAFGGDTGDREIRIVLTKLVEKVLGPVHSLHEEDWQRIISGDGVATKQEHATPAQSAGRALVLREYISTGFPALDTLLAASVTSTDVVKTPKSGFARNTFLC